MNWNYRASGAPTVIAACAEDPLEVCSASVFFFNWSDFRMIKGEPDYYRATELGRYAFCRNCGSTTYGAYDGSPSLYVYLGGLDNPDDWPSDAEGWSGPVFVDDKVSWYLINDGLP